MVSLLKSGLNKLKMGSEKFKLSFSFDTIEAKVLEKTNFQIVYERGRKQRETTRVIEFDVKKKVIGVNESFKRNVTVYYDKKSRVWEAKKCLITLGYIVNGKFTKIGSAKEINASESID